MKTILTLIIFVISFSTFSQLGIKAGFAIVKPVNNYTSGPYLGFNAGLTYEWNDRFRGEVLFERMYQKDEITFTTIEQNQESLQVDTLTAHHNIIPITLGLDYRILTGMLQPYVGLNIGMMTLGTKVKSKRYNNQFFTLHPKVGLNIDLTENFKLDLAIKHHIIFNQKNNGISNNQIFGANLGVNYNF
ncbi:porin family protein [Brumimicrobium mesophilum]|uniref:porin family protein n=1 Tax=Brumimicrobium mesophilum TaxID=392717 RepID=UPI000D140E1F|nr:porin family protein [Brumimicrobium mesophilum]